MSVALLSGFLTGSHEVSGVLKGRRGVYRETCIRDLFGHRLILANKRLSLTNY